MKGKGFWFQKKKDRFGDRLESELWEGDFRPVQSADQDKEPVARPRRLSSLGDMEVTEERQARPSHALEGGPATGLPACQGQPGPAGAVGSDQGSPARARGCPA